MSTFTDFNGPQGNNVRATDLIALADAYNRLTTTLQEHINNANLPGQNTHNAKDYVDSQIAEVRNLIQDFSQYLKKSEAGWDVNNPFLKESILPSLATKLELQEKVNADVLNDYLLKDQLASQQVIVSILQSLEALQTGLQSIENWKDAEALVADVIKANDYFQGLLHAKEQILFTDKQVTAEIGGSNLIGVYWLLGMLGEKAGDAFVKFIGNNDLEHQKQFEANVKFAGKSLIVSTDNHKLKGLCFLVVEYSGNKYLAVQSTDWMSKFASTDGYGLFDKLDFECSGVNFYPAGTAGYIKPNGNCNVLSECLSDGPGLAFSSLSTTVLNAQICREARNPYLTLDDVTTLDKLGLISQWPEWDENGVAINVPEGYHACDGTPVLDTDDVDPEFRERWTEYPMFDYSVIKTKTSIKINMDIPVRSSLAEAVCALHGIKFYFGLETLPATAKDGEPVIVQSGDTFAVYAYNEAEHTWKKYTTQYNDINKTIAAVASVIAAEHHADVYTVYTSVADLPTGPSVEVDSLAIVFDGVSYSVFKYNGTAWEVQA